MSKEKIKVCELFAGVGGFHIGLGDKDYDVVIANQWEPGKQVPEKQYAFNCYKEKLGAHFKGHRKLICDDIAKVKKQMKCGDFDLLVGGFPCQDYSVATTKAKGLQGKKGVLWWDIYDIIKKCKPEYILLENVDRLLRSPKDQRGRDFGVILTCLNKALGPKKESYHVEWRMINAADYGFPQKRRRTFIFATRNQGLIKKFSFSNKAIKPIFTENGFFSKAFPIHPSITTPAYKWISKNVQHESDAFHFDLFNAGVMYKGDMYTVKVIPDRTNIKQETLENALDEGKIDHKYYIDNKDIPAWERHKGSKKLKRTAQNGHEYHYSEGAIPFPDHRDHPSRTMLTSDGNTNPNRITHVIGERKLKDGKYKAYRVLTPEECEKLNGFPAGWTDTGMPERWRYFCMGNALVVGLIVKMGQRLKRLL